MSGKRDFVRMWKRKKEEPGTEISGIIQEIPRKAEDL